MRSCRPNMRPRPRDRSRSRGRSRPGQHVGHVGEDIGEGTAALRAGRRLRPQDVGLIASLGLAHVPVVKRPRVRILVTGNEVQSARRNRRVRIRSTTRIPTCCAVSSPAMAACSRPSSARRRSGCDPRGAPRSRRGRHPRFRRLERRQRRLRAEADRRDRRARHSRRRDAAVESGRCRPDRRDARVPAARQSGVLPLRVRFLRRPRHSPARRASGRLAAPDAFAASSLARSSPPSAASTIAASASSTDGSSRSR